MSLIRIVYYAPVMVVVPPLSPLPRLPRPSSMSTATLPVRASISPTLASSPSVFRLFVFPPVAPVVTRRPPKLTGGRCHAAPGFLSSVLMFVGVPPPTCAAGGTCLGCRWRGLGDGAPHDGLEFLDASTVVVWQVGCFGLRSRRSCPNTAVYARAAPIDIYCYILENEIKQPVFGWNMYYHVALA